MADRGLSTVLSYVLIIGITTVLISLLFASMAGFVEYEQRDTARSALETVGNDVAADIESADRLTRTGNGAETVELAVYLPDHVAESQYSIVINGSGENELLLRTHDRAVSVTIPFNARTHVEEATVTGAMIRIEYNRDRDTLVVQDV